MEQTQLTTADLKKMLLKIADECLEQGPGYAQEMVVLRKVEQELGIQGELEQQQRLLTVWNDLFRDGTLSWGYNIDTPGAPFFHRAVR